ncbi:MAG: hypothetical protein ACOVOW_11270 [Spirosomataceae bacterium]
METINKRLEVLIHNVGFSSLRKFDKEIGVALSQTHNIVGEKQCMPGSNYLLKVKERFPQVDLNWLISGEGDMFRPDPSNDTKKANEEFLIQENKMLKQRIQGLEFGLALAAKHSNFQQGNTAANFKFVSRNAPVEQHQLKIVWTAPNSSTNSRDEVSRRAL